jgi:hypothetical protein
MTTPTVPSEQDLEFWEDLADVLDDPAQREDYIRASIEAAATGERHQPWREVQAPQRSAPCCPTTAPPA